MQSLTEQHSLAQRLPELPQIDRALSKEKLNWQPSGDQVPSEPSEPESALALGQPYLQSPKLQTVHNQNLAGTDQAWQLKRNQRRTTACAKYIRDWTAYAIEFRAKCSPFKFKPTTSRRRVKTSKRKQQPADNKSSFGKPSIDLSVESILASRRQQERIWANDATIAVHEKHPQCCSVKLKVW